MKSLKRTKANELSNSSAAMSYMNMGQLTTCLRDHPDFSAIERVKLDAMFAIGFICWLRFGEILELTVGDLQRNVQSTKCDEVYLYSVLTVSMRKTHKADASKANVYQLHDDLLHEPNLLPYSKLEAWLTIYFATYPNLDSTALLFPKTDRLVITQHPIALSMLNATLKKLVVDAKITTANSTVSFTSHTFRRGGCQFRYFWSRKTWSLECIKGWGGWAENESNDTLLTYLFEETSRQEQGFDDLLSPFSKDRNRSTFGQLRGSSQVRVESQFDEGEEDVPDNPEYLPLISSQLSQCITSLASLTAIVGKFGEQLVNLQGNKIAGVDVAEVDAIPAQDTPAIVGQRAFPKLSVKVIFSLYFDGQANIDVKSLISMSKDEITNLRKVQFNQSRSIEKNLSTIVCFGEEVRDHFNSDVSLFYNTYLDSDKLSVDVLGKLIRKVKARRQTRYLIANEGSIAELRKQRTVCKSDEVLKVLGYENE